MEQTEEVYKMNYGLAVCEFLAQAYPEEFRQNFGSIEECARQAAQAADVWFDKWKVNYPRGLITRIKLAAGGRV